MARPPVTVLHAAGVLDIDSGETFENGFVRVEGNRITDVGTDEGIANGAHERIDLPELTLIPGLMDMEVDLVLGGPGAGPVRRHGARQPDDQARQAEILAGPDPGTP